MGIRVIGFPQKRQWATQCGAVATKSGHGYGALLVGHIPTRWLKSLPTKCKATGGSAATKSLMEGREPKNEALLASQPRRMEFADIGQARSTKPKPTPSEDIPRTVARAVTRGCYHRIAFRVKAQKIRQDRVGASRREKPQPDVGISTAMLRRS